ncbi:hypothetical protein P280DRAFT_520316 [Massarina eburnea CBS 473.64]|uniref:F-box domain-containing protein n=1 Tax=Massarina eburnea CBS 473.64 TaxID=1395130 RepID=A0A6A6RS37_9PLEO|nr:hypothetical protein P280DRAFT_520316 [Massarina eburnea CBS 473.64]
MATATSSPLPAELLLEIFQYLVPDLDTEDTSDARIFYRTFAALSRTCRSFQPIASHFLYRRYSARLNHPISPLLDRLRTEPELAHSIKDINIFGRDEIVLMEWKGRGKNEVVSHLQAIDLACSDWDWAETFTYKPEESDKHWPGYLDERLGEAELTILVAQCANLESLSTLRAETHSLEVFRDRGIMTFRIPTYIALMAQKIRQMPTTTLEHQDYSHLHTLQLNMCESYSHDLAYLFRLPSLRILRFYRLLHDVLYESRQSHSTELDWPVEPGTSKVEVLGFIESDPMPGVAVNMIASCKALQEFSLEYVTVDDYAHESHARECWKEIFPVLRGCHSNTLQHLAFDPKHNINPKHVDDAWHGFGCFRKLRVLHFPSSILLGCSLLGEKETTTSLRDHLPATLEQLTLTVTESSEMPGADKEMLLLSLLPIDDLYPTTTPNLQLRYGWDVLLVPGNDMLDVWRLKAAFFEKGRRFEYRFINTDSMDEAPEVSDILDLAQGLARWGLKGVELASHYELIGMPTRQLQEKVVEVLGLDEAWFDSDEGREIVFREIGEECRDGI